MKKSNKLMLQKIFNILLSFSIFITGICLMAGCISIYSIGDQPYSRQIVIETFKEISLPVYISIILIIIGFVIDFISPIELVQPKGAKPYSHILNRLRDKKDFEHSDIELVNRINKEQNSRKIQALIRTIIICISIFIFFAYTLNGNNYQTDINASVIKAMWILTPCFVIPAICSIIVSYQNEKSLKNEIELTKQLLQKENIKIDEKQKKDVSIVFVRLAILFIGIGFLIYGYFAGGTADVLTKAINICTECIGLG